MTNFEKDTRRHAQTLLDALADAARSELDTLRASVEARADALHAALVQPDAALLEHLVQELSAASQKEGNALAARVRKEVEQTAETDLAAARAEATAQAEAAQAVNTALLGNIEEARQQLRSTQLAAQAELDRTRQELEVRLAQAQKAHAALTNLLADAQRDVAAARSERDEHDASLEKTQAYARTLEQERKQLLVARDEASSLLDSAKRDVAAARSERDAHAVTVKQTQERLRVLELERKQLLVAREESSKLLEMEIQRVSELSGALETARQEVGVARAETDARGRELEEASQRVRTLEEVQLSIDRVEAPTADLRASNVTLLEQIRTALEAIHAATSASEILETLVNHLGNHFPRTAVFLVGPSSFKGWRARGFGATTDISNIAIPRGIDSLLKRTLAERTLVAVAGDVAEPSVGLLLSPIGGAVALPVVANDKVIAVVYAEEAAETATSVSGAGCKAAELLVDQASRRLTTKRKAPEAGDGRQGGDGASSGGGGGRSSAFSVARQARRVKMQEGVNITLDGSASFLVDLSTLGAQVLSPVALRPNHVVRMTLFAGEAALACKGRVIWALFEQPKGTDAALYRAGVRFTEVDSQAVEAFLARQGIVHDRDERALGGASLKGTA